MELFRNNWVRRGAVVLLISISAAALAGFVLIHPALVGLADRYVSDYQIAANSKPEPQHDLIVFVAITEETLARLTYRSPVDRKFLAELLTSLERQQVKGILLDMLFDQPTEPDKDELLKQTIIDLQVPIVVGYAGREEGLNDRQARYVDWFLRPQNRGFAWGFSDNATGIMRGLYAGRLLPNNQFVPSASIALLAKLGQKPNPPIGEDGLLLRYRGRPVDGSPSFVTYPAHEIDQLPAATLKDKVIVVGGDLSLVDRHRSPFGEIPGALGHAYALAELIDGSRAPEVSATLALIFTFFCAVTGALVACFPIPRLAQPAVLCVAMGIIWFGGFAVYRYWGLLFPLVTPTAAAVLAAWFGALCFGDKARPAGPL